VKILFYSSKPYEIQAFTAQNSSHKLVFQELPLNEATCQLAKGFEAVCVFVNDCLDAKVLQQLKELGVRFILLRCAGFNHVDLQVAKQLGLLVARVPAYSPHAVAEHAVALLLTLNRHTHKAYNRVRENNFNLNGLEGFDLHGRTVGVIGAGKIGLCFIRIMLGFGCRVLVFDPEVSAEVQAMNVEVVSLQQLFKQADIISLHCPLNNATQHLIDAEAIAVMKEGVVIINTSRGAVIDSKALIGALKTKKIGALGLDVYEEESDLFFQDHSMDIIQDDLFQRLLTFPNVLITGHQGFLTQEALAGIAQTTLANASELEKKGSCQNFVD
jgi:D-lactate dehydrogenase